MHFSRFVNIGVGIIGALAGFAQAQTYSNQIYVDNTKPTCITPGTCGSASNPYTNLEVAINQVTPGTEVLIAGYQPYYDSWMNFPASTSSNPAHILVRAWPGTGTPLIKGSKLVTGWTHVASTVHPGTYLYWAPWTQKTSLDVNFNGSIENPNSNNIYESDQPLEPQQVFRGYTKLKQVGGKVFNGYSSRVHPALSFTSTGHANIWPGRIPDAAVSANPEQLAPGHFWFDPVNQKIWVRLSSQLNTGEGLEVSQRQFLVSVQYSGAINNLKIQGIDFERTNTSLWWRGGAIYLSGSNIELQELNVRDADSIGVQLSGKNAFLYMVNVSNSGQLGINLSGVGQSAVADNIVSWSKIEDNNTRGFEPNWEAGGIKIMGDQYLNGGLLYGNLVTNNRGHGIWLDTTVANVSMEYNTVAYNDNVGIYLEMTSGNQVFGNIIVGNLNQGMQIRGAYNSVSENLIVMNALQGIAMPGDETRSLTVPGGTGYYPSGNSFTSNKFLHNFMAFGQTFGFELDMWFNSSVNANKYCGTQAYMARENQSGTTVTQQPAYDLTTWRGWGYDVSTSASRLVLPTSAVGPTQPLGSLIQKVQNKDLALLGWPIFSGGAQGIRTLSNSVCNW